MDKKSKIFFAVFFTLIFAVVIIAGYKFFVLKDYYITTELECDPAVESCFIYICDPSDDETCPENEAERTSYYKLIEKKAYNIPLCDPGSEDCAPLDCEGDNDCTITLCDQATEDCMYPEKFVPVNETETVELEETPILPNTTTGAEVSEN